MSKIKSIETLEVWQKTAILLEDSYRISNLFPQEEFFALTMRLRQAVAAIAGNLSEGYGVSLGARLQSLQDVLKNVAEVRQTIVLSHNCKYIDSETTALNLRQCANVELITRKLIYTLKHK
jgi:four helix bundle protein